MLSLTATVRSEDLLGAWIATVGFTVSANATRIGLPVKRAPSPFTANGTIVSAASGVVAGVFRKRTLVCEFEYGAVKVTESPADATPVAMKPSFWIPLGEYPTIVIESFTRPVGTREPVAGLDTSTDGPRTIWTRRVIVEVTPPTLVTVAAMNAESTLESMFAVKMRWIVVSFGYGETVVAPGYLIDRGHASVATRLATLGADITSEVVG